MSNKPIHDFILKGGKMFLPSLSVDCVIFGFHENQLKVLLLKMKNATQWSLPGGFIIKNEDVDGAATRVLQERTGLRELYLQQFHVFGQPRRSDANFHKNMLRKDGIVVKKDLWILQRFVTIGYYALVEYSFVTPQADAFSEFCNWQDVSDLPDMMMDHQQIITSALQTLRVDLGYKPVGYNLLPEKFTMPELQRLYETILGRKLDRRNFQRKILSYKILKRLNEVKTGVAHKAPFLYRFDLRKYELALREGLQSFAA